MCARELRARTPLQIERGRAHAFFLARQFLSTPAHEPEAVVKRLFAIQAQYAANVPGALWARTADLDPSRLEDALLRRAIVKTWCLRQTLHAITPGDLPLFVSALGRSQKEAFFGMMGRTRGYTRDALIDLEQETLRALAGGPLTRAELHDRVPRYRDMSGTGWGLDVKGSAFSGDLIYIDRSSETGSNEARFVLRKEWLPRLAWHETDATTALQRLLARYLEAYGPAAPRDFAFWAGTTVRSVQPLFTAPGAELVPVAVTGRNEVSYVRAEDEDALRSAPGKPNHPVRLLPKFDALLLAHRDKTPTVAEDHYKAVFRAAGQVEAVVLAAGRAIGTWRVKQTRRALTVTVEPLQSFAAAERKALQAEAERLGQFHGVPAIEIVWSEM